MKSFVLGIGHCNEPVWIFDETLGAAADSAIPLDQFAGVVVNDNGDTALESQIVHAFFDPSRALVHRTGVNTGCAGGWNFMLRHAFERADSAIILNGDCAVALDTFEKMIAAPGPIVCGHGFGCFRIDRELYERIGPFDEAFWPCYFEDTDYRRRLEIAGVAIDEWPFHEVSRPSFGRATYSTGITHGWRLEEAGYQGWTGEKLAEFGKRWEANRDRFIAKWGGERGHETFTTPFGTGDAACPVC